MPNPCCSCFDLVCEDCQYHTEMTMEDRCDTPHKPSMKKFIPPSLQDHLQSLVEDNGGRVVWAATEAAAEETPKRLAILRIGT